MSKKNNFDSSQFIRNFVHLGFPQQPLGVQEGSFSPLTAPPSLSGFLRILGDLELDSHPPFSFFYGVGLTLQPQLGVRVRQVLQNQNMQQPHLLVWQVLHPETHSLVDDH